MSRKHQRIITKKGYPFDWIASKIYSFSKLELRICWFHIRTNDSQPSQNFNNRIRRVDFVPFCTKVHAVRQFVVVILEQFTQHQEIED